LIFKNIEIEKRAEFLKEKVGENTDDVKSRMELGKIYLSEDYIEEAVPEFEKVLNIDPYHIQGHLLLALALQRHPKPDLSRVTGLLEKATQIAPDNADAHLNLAQVYEKLKNEEKSISEFDKAIELSSDPATLVSAHLGLMAIYKRRGELEKSQREYGAAYKIYPGIDEIIKQAEINRITHIEYAGEAFKEDGIHPSHEERIKLLREEIRKMLETK
jgi:Tfp pilus assembly protein PilF